MRISGQKDALHNGKVSPTQSKTKLCSELYLKIFSNE